MSTDIYLFAEKRVDESWQPIPPPQRRQPGRPGQLIPVFAIDMGQPYELFTLLCGTGIGRGSKFVEVPKLFGGRGFPADMNPIYREVLPEWCKRLGEETFESWVLLDELIAIDWDQPVHYHAYIEEFYADFFHRDKPYPEDLLKGVKLSNRLEAGMARVEWSASLREYVGCSEWFIEQVSALAPGAELRIIYWI